MEENKPEQKDVKADMLKVGGSFKIPVPSIESPTSDFMAKRAIVSQNEFSARGERIFGPGPHYEQVQSTEPFTFVEGKRVPLYKPQTDEEGRKKVRNSCVSGHMPDEAANCEYCKHARFNALTSGWYGDSPTVEQIEAFLRKTDFTASWQRTDYLFVVKYLELPEQIEGNPKYVDDFVTKVKQIDNLITLSALWNSSGQFMVIHPLLRKVYNLPNTTYGKSAFMEHLIVKDPVLLDIYSGSIVVSFEGSLESLRAGLERDPVWAVRDNADYPTKVAAASQEAKEVIHDFANELNGKDEKIPTGLAELDARLEGGLKRGELSTFGARLPGRRTYLQNTAGIPDVYHASPTSGPVHYRPAEEKPSRSERRKKKKAAVVKAKASPLLRGILILNKYTKE